ncbi:MAG: hypothetical protein JNL79_03170 [Myxococcales bacterium]|nr:hypothetical protein [Myxococcales bacterium]
MKDDDYLFDRSGAPDEEVQRLEALLGEQRYVPGSFAPRPTPLRRARWAVPLSLAAAAAVVIAVSFGLDKRRPVATSPSGVPSEMSPVTPGPALAILEGKGATVGGAAPGAMLPSSAWLETREARVRLTMAIGTLDLEPDAALRIVAMDATHQRVELARGTLSAKVRAPPFTFVIDTPEVRVVDLGCAYVLVVDGKTHAGSLGVTSGFVQLERGARKVIVPRGARASFGGGRIATPIEDDAPPALRAALATFEGGAADVAPILSLARKEDDFTLLDLAVRTEGPTRAAVLKRLVALVGLADGASLEVPLEGVLDKWQQKLRIERLERR